MRNIANFEYEPYPSDNHRLEGDSFDYHLNPIDKDMNKDGVKGFNLVQYPGTHPEDLEKFDLVIGFHSDQAGRERFVENLNGLLKDIGEFEQEFNGYDNSSLSLKIKKIKRPDFLKVLSALSQDKRLDRDNEAYKILDNVTAAKLLDHELEKTGITPMEAGLVNIQELKFERDMGVVLKYVDVELENYAATPVNKISENSSGSHIEDARIYTSTVELEHSQINFVAKALKQAGLSIKSSGNGYLKTEATAEMVTEALNKADMLPTSIHEATKEAAARVHPGQKEINQAHKASQPVAPTMQSKIAGHAL